MMQGIISHLGLLLLFKKRDERFNSESYNNVGMFFLL